MLGAAMFVGGIGRGFQSFDRTAAGTQSSMLFLAAGASYITGQTLVVNGGQA